MKNKHLLFAMALPALFAACADDDFTSQSNSDNAQGEFITLPANFALVQDNGGAQTKGAWNTNDNLGGSFYWLPEPIEGTSSVTFAPDRIGLSWTGVSLKEDDTIDPVGSALTSYSDRVFTNYKFEHFAWGIVGEELRTDPCDPSKAPEGAVMLQPTYYDGNWQRTKEPLPNYTAKSDLQDGDTDYHTGLFNTDNSTVYAGQYIVYAPYDAENVSNYIIASSKDVYEGAYLYNDEGNDVSGVDDPGKVWEYNDIFVYGTTSVSGGDQLTTFTTKNLHGYVSLALRGKGNVKKVILYDPEGRLLTKVGLSAKGIYEGKEGKDLYLAAGVAERETTRTITVEMEKRGKTASEAYPALSEGETRRVLIPVLPTESALDNVEIILVDDQNRAYRTTVESLEIGDNDKTPVSIDEIDFEGCGMLVTDELTLRVATGNQNDEDKVVDGFASGGADEAQTVELLGDIELTTTLAIRGNYTLNGGRIIIPGNNGESVQGYGNRAEVRMVVHNNEGSSKANPVIKSDILVKAAGCCMEFGGSLIVGNATIDGDVETENQASYADYEDYVDDLSADKSKHGMVKFNVTGATTDFNGTLTNNGRLDIGRSDRGEDDGATAAALQVNVGEGGGIVNNNQMTIFRYIEKDQTDTQYSAYLYVGRGGELSNSGTFTIEGRLAHYGSGKNSGVIYDRVSSTVSGDLINYNTENAEYICDVNDGGIRFQDAVEGRSKPTTTVRFVEDYEDYDFGTVDEQQKTTIKKYVIDVKQSSNKEETINMLGDIDLTGKDIVIESGRLGFLTYDDDNNTGTPAVNTELKVNSISVGEGGRLVMANVNANVATSVTVSGELYVRTTEFNIGSREQAGELTINAFKEAEAGEYYSTGFMECDNGTVTTVYGNIFNNGRVNIKEATASDGNIPAYLYYTGSVTGGPTNWVAGGASRME